MNGMYILESMTDIDSAYIASAQKRLDLLSESQYTAPGRRTIRRALVLIAAVIALMAGTLTTAMAVSEDFREMVFRFLHIEQEQIIPEPPVSTELSVENMFVEPKITVGGVIEGKYVHTPVSTAARGGVFLVCTDEVEMKQGSHYDAYYEENGEFIKLEEQLFSRDYTVHGWDIHVEFEWAEHNGKVHMTWVDPNDSFRMPNESGDAASVLFRFHIIWEDEKGENVGSWYPVLLDLHTGGLTDVLAGTGAERLSHIDNSAISADHTKILLGQQTDGGYFLHYVDLSAKKMYSIDELSGEHADSCSLIGKKLACWNLKDGYYKAWNIDLETLERTELFDSVPDAAATPEADAGIVFLMGFDDWSHWGDMYAGSSFALEVDEAQNVYVTDLATGAKTQIEGYVWTPNVQRTPSPDGTRLMLAGGSAGMYFEYVGVLDFANMTFVEFSRSNQTDEYLAYWFDENTIVICSEIDSESLCSDFYFYSLADSRGVG